jgi:hypothetical protein
MYTICKNCAITILATTAIVSRVKLKDATEGVS